MMSHSFHAKPGFVHSGVLFAVSQACLLTSIAVAAIWARPEKPAEIPALANQPHSVRLAYNWPEVVTDDQLANVLWKTTPPTTRASAQDQPCRPRGSLLGSGCEFHGLRLF